MKYIKGDLLKSNVNVMMHVANNYHVFGSGIAYSINQKFPEAYEADKETIKADSKMGTFSHAALVGKNQYIYNLYAMWGIGNDGHPLNRNCSYDSLYDALYNACKDIIHKNDNLLTVMMEHNTNFKLHIGVPYLMGCCRAGGSWPIVEAILKDIEETFSAVEFHVYQLEGAETKASSSVTI